MAYPIRFKIIHKQTGQTFKQWAISTGKSDAGLHFKHGAPYRMMPCLNEDGNAYVADFEGFYLSGEFLSPKDWELRVAIKKDAEDKWMYEKVGY